MIESSFFTPGDDNFNLEVRVNVKTIEEVKTFLGQFNHSSCCTFNVKQGRTDKKTTGGRARSLFSGNQKCCLHVVLNLKDSSRYQEPGKNTNCPAFLHFCLETAMALTKAQQIDKEEFPLWIEIHINHNHSIHRADYFKFLSVSDTTKSFYNDIFKQGDYLAYTILR